MFSRTRALYTKVRQKLFGMRIRIVLKSGYTINLRGVKEFKFALGGDNKSYELDWHHGVDKNIIQIDPREIAAVEWID